MKVTNWRKKIVAAIMAGGALVPAAGYAVNVPLNDPSFEAYAVNPYPAGPSPAGYAYSNLYRPTSGWVDDLDNPVSPAGTVRFQDDGVENSNWLYNSAYGNDGPPYRGTPRTGNQAMHGLHNYNAQETTTNFAAEKLYTFSVWAQGDNNAVADDNEVHLYLFNGNVPFGESTGSVVKKKAFLGGPGGNFNNRGSNGPVNNAANSLNNWTKLTLSHVVFPGDPVIGNPVGVGFFMGRDAAIDDATLDVDDASNHFLVLEVNTTNGQVRFRNLTPGAVTLDWYNIKSTNGALNSTTWTAIQQQSISGFPAGTGSGNGWEKAGGSSSTAIGESYLLGNSALANGSNVALGAAYTLGGTHDIVFEYGAITGTVKPTGDYNDNGVVDAADYVIWRKRLNQNVTLPNDSTPESVSAADYTEWRLHYGKTTSPAPSVLTRGLVHYVTSFSGSGAGESNIPEPSCIVLVGIGIMTVALGGRRRS